MKLFAFEPFKESGQGIKNIEALNKGKITDDLKSFLTSFLPKKSKKYQLGIGDIRLGSV